MARVRERKNDISFNVQLAPEQREAKANILKHPINVIIGAAGCGKTLLTSQIALDAFFTGECDQIIITRSTITAEAGGIGFLPGMLEQKMDPLLQGIYQNFFKLYGDSEAKRNKIKKHIESGDIKIIPIAYMRSITFDNAYVIIDEVQNLTRSQFELVIGRLGKTSKLLFTGSKDQIDLPKKSSSAIHLLNRISASKYVYIVELLQNHRHPAVEDVLGLLSEDER